MEVFLDACVIIYWAEASEPFYSKLVTKLGKIAEKNEKINLSISRLSLLESLAKPIREKNRKILDVYTQFFNQQYLQIIEIDAAVVDAATKLRAKFNVRTPYAIQAASAICYCQNPIFVTNDKIFTRIPGINATII